MTLPDSSTKKRPNLVLILTDHWRGDCLGRLRHPVAETPHLDSMSLYGTTFTRAYTPSPSCIAARRTLTSGQTPARHGMVGYEDGIAWEFRHTLAGTLAQTGYQTINIGKTHFYPESAHLGFEVLKGEPHYRKWLAKHMPVEERAHGVPPNSWIGRPHILPEAMIRETWDTSEAIAQLQSRDTTRPYFMCLSFIGPHPPWCPPQVYYDQFINRPMPAPLRAAWSEKHAEQAGFPLDVNAWRGRLPEHLQHRAQAAYFGYLAYLDAQIGRFLANLPEADNTLIIMTADHGEMLGDHNLWRKTYAYEPSARIPFIIRPPLHWECPRNKERADLVGLEDVMPTFIDAAGCPIPDTVEGRSIVPLLKGQSVNWRKTYHGEHSPCYAIENANQYITDADWKYIWNTSTGDEQLFLLREDPQELHDLAAVQEHSDTLEHFRSLLVERLRKRPEGLSDGIRLFPKIIPAWQGSCGVHIEG